MDCSMVLKVHIFEHNIFKKFFVWALMFFIHNTQGREAGAYKKVTTFSSNKQTTWCIFPERAESQYQSFSKFVWRTLSCRQTWDHAATTEPA